MIFCDNVIVDLFMTQVTTREVLLMTQVMTLEVLLMTLVMTLDDLLTTQVTDWKQPK